MCWADTEFIENEKIENEKKFRYISNIFVNNDNIKEVVFLGSYF